MNRDFVIPSTPGNARTLVKMSRVTKLNLDPAVAELAATDLVRAAGFTPPEQNAIQSLLDFDFRAILPGPMLKTAEMVFWSAKHAGIETIVVMGNHHFWQTTANLLASKFGYVMGQNYHVLARNRTGLDSDFIRENRHGLFLYEADLDWAEHILLTHSFPKSVGLTNTSGVAGLAPLARTLFPESPTALLENNFFLRSELAAKGFSTTKPEDLAFLLNVVFDHFQKEPEPVVEVDDIPFY